MHRTEQSGDTNDGRKRTHGQFSIQWHVLIWVNVVVVLNEDELVVMVVVL